MSMKWVSGREIESITYNNNHIGGLQEFVDFVQANVVEHSKMSINQRS